MARSIALLRRFSTDLEGYAYDGTRGQDPVAIELRGGRGTRPGDRLTTGFAPEALHVFDTATGLRLR